MFDIRTDVLVEVKVEAVLVKVEMVFVSATHNISVQCPSVFYQLKVIIIWSVCKISEVTSKQAPRHADEESALKIFFSSVFPSFLASFLLFFLPSFFPSFLPSLLAFFFSSFVPSLFFSILHFFLHFSFLPSFLPCFLLPMKLDTFANTARHQISVWWSSSVSDCRGTNVSFFFL